jgi:aminopeptidase N
MKKNTIIVFILCVIITNAAFSNRWLLKNDWTTDEYYKYKERLQQLHRDKQALSFLAGDSTNSFDVLKYDITLDWYNILNEGKNINPENKYWDGKITITFKSNIDGLSIVPIDAVDLDIISVSINSVLVSPTPKIVNNVISIPLNALLNKDEQSQIDIDYRYNKFENVGFNLYYQGDINSNTKVEENIAYTVNSPEFARFWFPCNDTPRDKVALDMHVKVPYGYNVASNGMLINIENINSETGNDYSVYHWSDTTPIATFLINVVASKFSEYSEWFSPTPLTPYPDSLEIKYYIWEADLEGNIFSAKKALQRTKQILEYFSTIFIDYPFCKYGSVEVFPFIYSAMENQTMTNITKLLFKVTADGNTIAHEIAHHWFGNLVSSKDWNDIWFKEGGATWSEALWAFERFGKQENAYLNVMRQNSKAYFQYPELFNIPVWGNSPDEFFSIPLVYLTYNKASWIFHQLNMFIGQEKNLDILKKILTKYAYKNIDAEMFIQMYKDELKDYPLDFDINKYFDQWLFGAGHPIYDCQSVRTLNNPTDSTWNVQMILTQTQQGSKIAEVFETPIWVIFFNGNKEVYKERLINNKKIQEYYFSNVPNFTICKVDSSRTLCQNATINLTTTGIENNVIGEVFAYPNPAVNQRFVYIAVGTNNIIDNTISITNTLGIEQTCIINKLDNTFQIDISNLINGLYFVKLDNKLLKFSIIK